MLRNYNSEDFLLPIGNEQLRPANFIIDEVLQPSSLVGYLWPDTNPLLVEQKTRLRTLGDSQNVMVASTNIIFILCNRMDCLCYFLYPLFHFK